MDRDQAMIIAGIGCRKDCGAEEIVSLVREALARAAQPASALAALAIPAFKEDATALRQAAEMLGLPLHLVSEPELEAVEPRCATYSAITSARLGLKSVAESAALAAAGDGGKLLLPRIKGKRATCALAVLP